MTASTSLQASPSRTLETALSTTPIAASSTNKYVSPEHIRPIPVYIQTIGTRGRKKSTAACITTSPYKKALEESVARMKKQKASQGRGRGHDSSKTTTSGCIKRLSLEPASFSPSLINKTGNQGRCESGRGRYCTSSKRGRSLSLDEYSSSQSSVDEPQTDGSNLDLPPGELSTEKKDVVGIFYSEAECVRQALWIQCNTCEEWVRIDCTNCDRDAYVCDFCRG